MSNYGKELNGELSKLGLADLRLVRDYCADMAARSGGKEKYKFEDLKDVANLEIKSRITSLIELIKD